MTVKTASLFVVVVAILFIASGCQTTARVVKAVFDATPSIPSSDYTNMPGTMSTNPWPILGALLAFAGAVWGAITRDWQTGLGAMAAGMAMGLIGVAFNHPYAPLAGLILVIVGAGFKIRKYLLRND
jgi:hypothetical protein